MILCCIFLHGMQKLKILLNNGANINIQGDLGYTALHYACMKGHISVVELLLKHNASKTIKNEFGEQVIDINNNASHNHKKEISALLKVNIANNVNGK